MAFGKIIKPSTSNMGYILFCCEAGVITARGLHGDDSWRTLILLKWKLWGARYLNQIKYGNANDDFIIS